MNRAPVDPWTIVHAAVGGAAGLARLPLPLVVGGLAAYELAELAIEHPRGSPIFGTKRPEAAVNVAMDLAVGLAAYGVARWAAERALRPT